MVLAVGSSTYPSGGSYWERRRQYNLVEFERFERGECGTEKEPWYALLQYDDIDLRITPTKLMDVKLLQAKIMEILKSHDYDCEPKTQTTMGKSISIVSFSGVWQHCGDGPSRR